MPAKVKQSQYLRILEEQVIPKLYKDFKVKFLPINRFQTSFPNTEKSNKTIIHVFVKKGKLH